MTATRVGRDRNRRARSRIDPQQTEQRELSMKSIFLILPVAALLAGCQTTPQQNTLAGAAAGAALGSVVADDDDRIEGAIIGGIAGAAAGSLIGRNERGQCIYRRSDGTTFTGPC
jgi:outer membrane lipoprotein SlyB